MYIFKDDAGEIQQFKDLDEAFGKEGIEGRLDSSNDIKLKCPGCGKSNAFSLNKDHFGHCHHCSATISKAGSGKPKPKKEKVSIINLPPAIKAAKPNAKAQEYLSKCKVMSDEIFEEQFEPRGITMDSIKAYGIGEIESDSVKGEKAVVFPYYENNIPSRVKIRWYDENCKKQFKQPIEGKNGLYKPKNINEDANILWLQEGEIDTLSAYQVAPSNVICCAVPGTGATKAMLADSEFIRKYREVWISPDSDEAGRKAIESWYETIKKIDDTTSVYLIDMAPHEDVNEALVNGGPEAIQVAIDNRRDLDDRGVADCSDDDFVDRILNKISEGKLVAESTGYDNLDEIWKWCPRTTTLISGYANQGKSTLAMQLIAAKLFIDPDFKIAVFSPEYKSSEDFMIELINIIAGRSINPESPNRVPMEVAELLIRRLLAGRVFFISHNISEGGNAKVDDVLLRARNTANKHDIKALILDPYNMFDHEKSQAGSEAEYVSQFSNKLNQFAQVMDVAVVLVAHQVTPEIFNQKTKGQFKQADLPTPSIYKVRGGGNFADKFDFVLLYWRPYFITNPQHPQVLVKAGKIKAKEKYDLDYGTIEMCWHASKYRLVEIDGKTSEDVWYNTTDQQSIDDGTASPVIPDSAIQDCVIDKHFAELIGIETDGYEKYQFIRNNDYQRSLIQGVRRNRHEPKRKVAKMEPIADGLYIEPPF